MNFLNTSITSHQQMDTAFSGTDTEQIKKWASTAPYYLSIVTNNKLEFTAKVAIKSTEVYTGYSFFRDLFGKQKKTPNKKLERESYEIIDVEVIKETPDYMDSVNERLTIVEEYSSRPVYSGWHDNTYDWAPYNNSQKWNSYHANNNGHVKPELTNPVIQTELFNPNEIPEEFIDNGLELYGMTGHKFNPPYQTFQNILRDEHQFGIPKEQYKKYIEMYTFYDDEKLDERLVTLLATA